MRRSFPVANQKTRIRRSGDVVTNCLPSVLTCPQSITGYPHIHWWWILKKVLRKTLMIGTSSNSWLVSLFKNYKFLIYWNSIIEILYYSHREQEESWCKVSLLPISGTHNTPQVRTRLSLLLQVNTDQYPSWTWTAHYTITQTHSSHHFVKNLS